MNSDALETGSEPSGNRHKWKIAEAGRHPVFHAPSAQMPKNCPMAVAVSLIVAGFRAGTRSTPGTYSRMTEKSRFHSKMIKNGRWTVVVATGYGPASRVGDFATEEEAQRWISTKSKDWSAPTHESK